MYVTHMVLVLNYNYSVDLNWWRLFSTDLFHIALMYIYTNTRFVPNIFLSLTACYSKKIVSPYATHVEPTFSPWPS